MCPGDGRQSEVLGLEPVWPARGRDHLRPQHPRGGVGTIPLTTSTNEPTTTAEPTTTTTTTDDTTEPTKSAEPTTTTAEPTTPTKIVRVFG